MEEHPANVLTIDALSVHLKIAKAMLYKLAQGNRLKP
jgi:hypothetical protein